MPRARNVPATRKRRKKVLKKARGYFGNKSRLFRYAKDAVDRGEAYAYSHRRKRKTEFRQPVSQSVCYNAIVRIYYR